MGMTPTVPAERPPALLAALRQAAQEVDVDRLAILLLPRPGMGPESPLQALEAGDLRLAWRRCDRWGPADRIRWTLVLCILLESAGAPEDAFATLRRLDKSEWPPQAPMGRATAVLLAEAATTDAERIARLSRTLDPESRLVLSRELVKREHFDAAARCALDFDHARRQRLLPYTAMALARARRWDDSLKACERMRPVVRAHALARVARLARPHDTALAARCVPEAEKALALAQDEGACPALPRLSLAQLRYELGDETQARDEAQAAIHEAVQSERFPDDCLRAARRLQKATWAPERVKILARLADFLRVAGVAGVLPLHVLLMLGEVAHEQDIPELVEAAFTMAVDQATEMAHLAAVPPAPECPRLLDSPDTAESPETAELPRLPEFPDTAEVPCLPESLAPHEAPRLPESFAHPEAPECPQSPECPVSPEPADDLRLRRSAMVFLCRAATSLARVGRRDWARRVLRKARRLVKTLPPGLQATLALRSMARHLERGHYSRLALRFLRRAHRLSPPGALRESLRMDIAILRARSHPDPARRLVRMFLAAGRSEPLHHLLERAATRDRLDRVLGPVEALLPRSAAEAALDCGAARRRSPESLARAMAAVLMKDPPTQRAIRHALADVGKVCASCGQLSWARWIESQPASLVAETPDPAVDEARRRIVLDDRDGFARYVAMESENPVRAIRLFGMLADLEPTQATRVARLLLRRLT